AAFVVVNPPDLFAQREVSGSAETWEYDISVGVSYSAPASALNSSEYFFIGMVSTRILRPIMGETQRVHHSGFIPMRSEPGRCISCSTANPTRMVAGMWPDARSNA